MWTPASKSVQESGLRGVRIDCTCFPMDILLHTAVIEELLSALTKRLQNNMAYRKWKLIFLPRYSLTELLGQSRSGGLFCPNTGLPSVAHLQACPRQQQEGEKSEGQTILFMSVQGSCTHHFISHWSGFIMWPHLATREAGKCSL